MSGYGQPADDAFGPAERGGRKRRGFSVWRKVALTLMASIMVFGLGLVATVGALVWRGQSEVEQIQVQGITAPGDTDGDGSADIQTMTEVMNVLVIGSDSREGLSPKERAELATGSFSGTRTDTIMLLRLDPNRDTIAGISFPRDLYVELCDGSMGRINSAFTLGEDNGKGGVSCLVQTITRLTGIPIQHYVGIDLAGFVQLVETVGGVTLYLEQPMQDTKAGLDLPAGCVTLDAADALAFVRTRNYDNDYGRIARQQRFIKELVDEVTSFGNLVNVPRLFSMVGAAARAVETDQTLTLDTMRRMAMSLRDVSSDRIVLRTVPGRSQLIGGAAVEVPVEDQAKDLYAAFRNGELIANVGAGGPVTSPPPPLTAADVSPVTVLNGAGIAGLAEDTRRALVDRGFTVAGMDNFSNFDVARTRVVFPPRLKPQAEVLADALGDAELRPDEGATALQVVLGADLDLAALPPPAPTPTASPAAAETPTPTATPSPEYRGVTGVDAAVEC